MRLLLLIVAASLTTAIVWGAWNGRSRTTPPPPATEVAVEPVADPESEADSLDRLRKTVLARASQYDSYLIHQLREDGLVRRWRDRRSQPLRIYYHESTVPHNLAPRAARRAFRRWRAIANAGIPVLFDETRDSSLADVQVRWYANLPDNRAGRADVVYTGAGWMRSAELSLAWRAVNGQQIPEDALYTVALHEIGHLLGLGHSDDPDDVMYPTTSVHDLTARDRTTAWLLYQVPPGPVTSDLFP